MLPSVLAHQVEAGVRDFLSTTFAVSTPHFKEMMDQFFEEEALFKGPYLSLQLPFHVGDTGTGFFKELSMAYPAYRHQEMAFRNLTAEPPRSTLVATGTGSGKTECFLYPILDHCRKTKAEPGIKAIILYPMNALATDQAKRVAELISRSPELQGVRAGLYVGQKEASPKTVMTPDYVITDREVLRQSPPDILLTNYKMLDYLLLRPEDAVIWHQNDPETLQFLVVDELHTFDGAQGTDLACLIRRLKDRLGTAKDGFCCVGTSATLGSDEVDGLLSYASQMFGVSFAHDSLVTESRLTAGEFLGDAMVSHLYPPGMAAMERLDPERYESAASYLSAQVLLWFDFEVAESDITNPDWCVFLGETLKSHLFFQNIVKALKGRVMDFHALLPELTRFLPKAERISPEYTERLLVSLIALVSLARSNGNRPFVQVRVQHWLRELGRMVVSTGANPRLRHSDDLTEDRKRKYLPVVHCRECGAMGWVSARKPAEDRLSENLREIYEAFFARRGGGGRTILFPEKRKKVEQELEGNLLYFCGDCLHLEATGDGCTKCDSTNRVQVFVPNRATQTCPYCHAHKSLTLLGSRAASLSSVMIGQLNASIYNTDRKLITFSDNVQDAAHRAGFFGARTWSFNLRTAIGKVAKANDGIRLSDFQKAFCSHWKQELDLDTYIAAFIAPNMEWYPDYTTLMETGALPEKSRLLERLDSRLAWEVLSEFGFDSRIGRTLEKSGCAIAGVDEALLQRAVEQAREVIANEVAACREVTEATVRRYLLGFLYALRVNGAIESPVFAGYLKEWGKTFMIRKDRWWMQGFGPNSRTPKFLTDRFNWQHSEQRNRFQTLAHPKHRTQLEAWTEKTLFPGSLFENRELLDVLRYGVDQLVKAGILKERVVDRQRIWGIQPEALTISTSVSQMQCAFCGHRISIPNRERADWEGAPCTRTTCEGKYQWVTDGKDYYGILFDTGAVTRLVAREHTGLLDRTTRESVEREFKAKDKERKPWFPNLLSCTPTLEMGIDIGNLSATLQCSVPPAQANYLQRIGRAGRTNGNALNLTLVNLRPHDMYFFSDPMEMMAGKVESPGIFLDAAAVLERQLTAYGFDRWVRKGVREEELPKKLGTILDGLNNGAQGGFPDRFLRFVKENRVGLLRDFVALFDNPPLSDPAILHLEQFIEGDPEKDAGSFGHKVVEGLRSLLEERKSLKARIQRLRRQIKADEAATVKGQDHEEKLKDLKQEKNGLKALVTQMNKKNVFNFFTDEGLLPNYAFPEQGVTLQSIIYRKTVDKKPDSSLVFEYERAASSAIRELAPSNTFYAGGRRVVVDQVDLQLSQPETWRFCPECTHAELIGTGVESPVCPGCGNGMWGDSGRKFEMIRLRQVFATTSDRDSRISDDKDEREPLFYVKQLLMDARREDVTQAYRLASEETVFGYEYLSSATFREVNFGAREEEDTETISVAGEELPRPGFRICKGCGKVPTYHYRERKQVIKHAYGCKSRDVERSEDILECAYLYREFASEAIKILLPITGLEGSEVRQESFVAALHLGLKKKFGGAIDHLRSTLHTEPIPDSTARKQFLVIYDTVPGGTGYLKQLMGQNVLMEVLELAHDHMETCSCATASDKDGCYGCLLAYRNSFTMDSISRRISMEMIRGILKDRDAIKSIRDLSGVSLGPLFDSELEGRFLRSLETRHEKGCPVQLVKDVVHGEPGFLLTIGKTKENKGIRWHIAQQVEMDSALGISVYSRADFVFYPIHQDPSVKPIVVFTDGYTFHRDRIGTDFAQRMAIVRSGNFHVWSLSFKDVDQAERKAPSYYTDWFSCGGATPQKKLRESVFEKAGLPLEASWENVSSFRVFFDYLKSPNPKQLEKLAVVHGLGWVARQPVGVVPELGPEFKPLPEGLAESWLVRQPNGLFGDGTVRNPSFVSPAVWVEKAALWEFDPKYVAFLAILEDGDVEERMEGFESAWNGFLHGYNLFQFLPDAVFVARSGLETHLYEAIPSSGAKSFHPAATPRFVSETDAESDWRELKELVMIGELIPLIEEMERRALPIPVAGEEFLHAGEVMGEMELAWPDRKIAIIVDDETTLMERLRQDGWRVLEVSELQASGEPLLSLFEEVLNH